MKPLFPLLGVLALVACDKVKDAVDDVVEDTLGCSEAQIADVTEPDLPDCSRVAACCRFLSGDCGEVRFVAHPDVKTACDVNEAVLAGVISTYQSIDGESCPDVLAADACAGGVEETRANYRELINDGVRTSASTEAPSCRRIAKETIGKLAQTAGESADLLPEACEALDGDSDPIPAEGEGEGGGEGEGEGEGENAG